MKSIVTCFFVSLVIILSSLSGSWGKVVDVRNLHPSAAESTGTDSSVAYEFKGMNAIVLHLVVSDTSVITDTTTLLVKIQESIDNSNWVDLDSFTTVTDPTYITSERKTLTNFARYLRLYWTITWQGKYTFTCFGSAKKGS
jgi:hypothetical protein